MRSLINFKINEKGNILVIVALAMVALIGVAAIAIDGARLFSEKSGLQKAVDAAALASAQFLPSYPNEAEFIAKQILYANRPDLTESNIFIEMPEDHSSIRVTATSNVQYTLARALDFNNDDVSATAKVVIYPLTSYRGNGLVPFGIDLNKYNEENPDFENLINGDVFELKWGISETGNFGPLSINGTGASIYKETIINGSTRELNIGDILDTETGNMVGPTEQGLNKRFENCNWDNDIATIHSHINNEPDCPRFVILPVYRPFNVENNQIKQVEIIGFSSVFITDLTKKDKDNDVKDGILKAVYIERTVYGGSSSLAKSYGIYGYKLVE